jgi:hypothetical protein
MAKIDMMWLNDGMHGRADKTSRTYVKGDKVTGRTYAVTLRNPVYGKDFKNGQIRQNNKFGALNMGIAAWYNMAKAANADAADKAQLEKFIKAVKAQNHYPTVRALIMGKRYATVNEELSAVTISDGSYTKTVEIVFNARPTVPGNDSDPEFDGGGDSGSGSVENVTISLSAVGNGKVSIDGGTAGISKSKSVAPGTSVAILATPDSGATFTRWSDGNTEASRNVVVSAAMSLTATFSGGNAGGGDGPSEG